MIDDAWEQQLRQADQAVRELLFSRRNPQGHWTGRLSTSALSTATAIMALEMMRRQDDSLNPVAAPLIDAGLRWLVAHQNQDGGWGDTVKSFSNISTTMLANAVFHATGSTAGESKVVVDSQRYIDRAGGVDAVIARYGQDRTFSVPILTHCALAGLVDWERVTPLPFELACFPPRVFAALSFPVVSYALPALIAIGQVRHHQRKPWNPLLAWLRDALVPKSLRVLNRIQPENGGFLEAVPLTSFVTMSLAGKGLQAHPVARRGFDFIVNSVLEDGSWPIDTNLATWVTTLSVNALGGTLDDRQTLVDWLLAQQYKTVHPYTNSPPGGWAWTNLPGGVPDADDTPGAILALLALSSTEGERETIRKAVLQGVEWLTGLQNRDGGWPTFCRGWGTLPFDRSSCDITAHCIRAVHAAHRQVGPIPGAEQAIRRGFRFLGKQQRADGSWLPLWFGNQHLTEEENPVYGTSRVLLAYRDANALDGLVPQEAVRWLRSAQNTDGGWGGARGTPSSVEETSLALESLISADGVDQDVQRGLNWLMERIADGSIADPSPIGFYFAKLWYFEELYPVIFATGALRRALLSIEHRGSSLV